jgi:hypothetical protein
MISGTHAAILFDFGGTLDSDGVTDPKPLVRIGGVPQVLRIGETPAAILHETARALAELGWPAPSPRRRRREGEIGKRHTFTTFA